MFIDDQLFKSYDPDHNPTDPHYNTPDTDIFALALIVLMLMKMDTINQIYDFDNFAIHYHVIDQFIGQLREQSHYSDFLIDLI